MKKRFQPRKKDGFTLIITIILMSMLTVLSIGLLTLGAVTLRGGTAAESKRTANANAQMALMLAIGDLQKSLGDDKRITADASLLSSGNGGNSPQGRMVGVWNSENPYTDSMVSVSSLAAPQYEKEKSFKKWLVSAATPSDTESKSYSSGSAASSGPVLFSTGMDGFELRGESVNINSGNSVNGSYAWAVSQEGTKAKINVGTDIDRVTGNDGVQAPTRPDLKIGGIMSQPDGGWDQRNGRVISMPQAVLDSGYGLNKSKLPQIGPDYTASAQGVLADVGTGRLKTDLSLAFEMPLNSYQNTKWGDYDNLLAQGTYRDTPIFTPVTGSSGIPFGAPAKYVDPNAANETIFAGSPPTFGTLRSYYRLYRHLYSSGGSPTVWQRPQQTNYWNTSVGGYPAQKPVAGNATGVGPILDRMLLVFGIYVTPDGQAAVCITPIITLWNPYNTALDADGFVAYPYVDIPSFYHIYKNGQDAFSSVMSQTCGLNLKGDGAGRQMEPYFYCEITANGTGSMNNPIHFAPGEVKVFQPASATPVVFRRPNSIAAKNRVVRMMPATTSISQARGGIAYPANQTMGGGAGLPVAKTDVLALQIDFQVGSGSSYRYGVALENSKQIVNGYSANIEKNARFWSNIQVFPSTTANGIYKSIDYPASVCATIPQPATVIETYHRTELPSANTSITADLLLTTNIRQRYQYPNLSASANFTNGTGPTYETHMRRLANFLDLNLQMTGGGQSFYGMSNSSSGKNYLSLFDIPREPLLSLGSFQNADLTDVSSAASYQFGNSWASPYIQPGVLGQMFRSNATGTDRYAPGYPLYDTSYLTNAFIWDGYYFSSLAARTATTAGSGSDNNYVNDSDQVTERTKLTEVINNWIDDPAKSPLRNPRHVLYLGDKTKEQLKSDLAEPQGAREAAAHMLVDGAFNVNSTSVTAWASVLASARNDTFTIEGAGSGGTFKAGGSTTPFSRLRYPAGPALSTSSTPDEKWNAFRELSDSEIQSLAQAIVEEVKSRGPFQSLAEFVNRRLTGTGNQALVGALQQAIDNSGINSKFDGTLLQTNVTYKPWTYRSNLKNPVPVAIATPGWLTQGDVLTSLAPFITVRSDTFTVRGYGDARDANGKIVARSWCEATVQRVPEFVDPSDDPAADLSKRSNLSTTFGRQFKILAFRWVAPEEIEPS